MFVAKLLLWTRHKVIECKSNAPAKLTIQEVHKKGTNVQKSWVSKETVVLLQVGEWASKIAGSGLTIHHNGNST